MGGRENEQFRKLFIGGLSYETTEDSLKAHFVQYGNVVDCVVMKDSNTKKSRGFGFITYSSPEELEQAQKARPHKIDGRGVESKRAMPRNKDGGEGESSQSCKKMFVGGLPDDISEDQIRGVFGEYGEIEKVDLIKDKTTGKMKRFCFVTFFDYDSVDQCVLKKKHDMGGRLVEVKKAVPKDQEGGMGGRGGGRGGGMMGGGRGRGGGMMGSGRGGGRGGGGWDQSSYNQQGGYNDFNNQGGGYSGGNDYNQNWNQGGGGGYDSYNSGYNNQNQNNGGNWGGNQQQSFGQNYGDGYGGGAMRGGGGGGNYNQQRSGPYNQQGNYNRGGGGGGGYNRR
ncbi:heterogeneous nuclear ribonucleoprotein A1-like [Argopecten irradians]|uniref:heterogeneous nuclear ribonucleoprotein A1-like n=1 Tax=Argopecten irradians TaxID=31199 RepID=UPI0037160999